MRVRWYGRNEDRVRKTKKYEEQREQRWKKIKEERKREWKERNQYVERGKERKTEEERGR